MSGGITKSQEDGSNMTTSSMTIPQAGQTVMETIPFRGNWILAMKVPSYSGKRSVTSRSASASLKRKKKIAPRWCFS